MIDLDDFKTLNDRHGHVVGDRVLKALSDLLQDMVRASDIVGRFGGEEFLILLPQTVLPRRRGGRRTHPQGNRPLSLPDRRRSDRTCHLTISIGVYSSPAYGQNVEEIINLTDAALYRAKKEGKNKVVVVVR